MTEEQAAYLKAKNDSIQKDKEDLEVKRLTQLATKAYEEDVQNLIDSLLGLSNFALEKLIDAWDRLTKAGHADEAAIENLWEAYKKLREDLAPGELPEDIERITRGLRLQEEAAEFAASTAGKFISSMAGFDPVAEELLSNQDKIIKQFNDLEGVMDPRFFEEHGRMLETLAEHYGDDLEPELQGLIKAYEEWGKTSETTTDSVIEDQEKASTSIVEASNRMTASMMDKQAELNAFTLSAQDAEIVGLKKGYNIMKLNHAKAYDDMVEDIELLPEAERFAGIMRLNQLKADGEKKLELEEKIGLLRILKALDVDDKILRNHEEHTNEWLEAEIKIIRRALDEWDLYHIRVETLTSVAGLFDELSNIVPGLQEISQALGNVASATGAWGTNIKLIQKTQATTFEKITGAIGAATAAMAAFNAISKVGSRGARGAMGAMAGAQMGSAFGPIGAAIGGLVGGIAGLLMKDPGWKKIESTIKNQWGISVSQTLSKEIAVTAKEIGSDLGASLLHINQVIDEAGGVTAGNVGKWTRHVRDAFSMIDQGIFTASQAAEVLDENFASLVKAGTQLGGVLRADVFELIRLDEQFRTNSQAIKEFKEAMVNQAIEGLMLFAEGVTFTRQKWEEAFNAKIAKVTELGKKTEEEINQMRENFDEKLFRKLKGDFNELSAMVEMAFATMVLQGKSLVEILLTLGPALDELTVLVEALGYTGSETIEMLMRLREFTKVNEGLMKKIAGTQMMLVGLTNSGYMSEKMFKQFGRTVTRQFNQLIAKGMSADETLMIMMPSLIALEEGARLYGFEISKNTQKLIDQAKERGLMGNKAKTVDDHMLEAQHAMVDALGALILLFGGELPDSLKKLQDQSKETAGKIDDEFQTAVDGIQGRLDHLHMPDLKPARLRVNVEFGGDHFDSSNWGGSLEFDEFQHGGIINKPTLAMAGEGGQSEMIGPVGFMSKALEGALAETGPSRVEREMLEELHGLRSDLKTLPLHLRDALILAG